MNATEIIRNYVNVWNGRNADTLLAVFTKDGIYSNPDTYPGVGGEALADLQKECGPLFRTLLSNYSM
jgi:hypothetical protein